jgi:glutaredoxin
MQPENAAPADSITPVERTVLMYSRPGCGLCDEARRVILGVRERTPFRYEEVDISGDDALELEYGIRIPVVLVDGEERFEVRVDASELAFALRG